MKMILIAAVGLAAIVISLDAHAQGIPGGAAHGYNEGNRIAGPIGGIVGTAVGGVIGGVEGALGIDQHHYVEYPERPYYRTYRHQRWHRRVRR